MAPEIESGTGVTSQSLQEIVCCMGQPVAGNPTQYVMEKAFARAGIDWRYLTLEIAPEELGDAMRGMRAMGFRGANFLAPHQAAVVGHLDDLGDVAALLGEVNCVSRRGEELVGENTDGKGLLYALGGESEIKDRRVVILGAGGAARAIGVELALAGAAAITVVSRTEVAGEELLALLDRASKVPATLVVAEDEYEVSEEADILIGAVPAETDDATAGPTVDVETLGEDLVVADLAVNPPQTPLLRKAAERGCRTVDGLAVLVGQAAAGFKIWTDVEPDKSAMRDALEEFFGL